MFNIFVKKIMVVMINVLGLVEVLKFCGLMVEKMMFWVL